MRILLVDDDFRTRQALLGPLPAQLAGKSTFEEVESLAEAIKYLYGQVYDAIVLDLGLPDSQGVETFFKVKQAAPDTPIVVLTGTRDEDLAQTLMSYGAASYVVKGSTDPRQFYRNLASLVIYDKHHVRISDGEAAKAAKAAMTTSRRMRAHASGEFKAVKPEQLAQDQATVLEAQSTILAVVSAKVESVVTALNTQSDRIAAIQSDIRELKTGHEVQDLRISSLEPVKTQVDYLAVKVAEAALAVDLFKQRMEQEFSITKGEQDNQHELEMARQNRKTRQVVLLLGALSSPAWLYAMVQLLREFIK